MGKHDALIEKLRKNDALQALYFTESLEILFYRHLKEEDFLTPDVTDECCLTPDIPEDDSQGSSHLSAGLRIAGVAMLIQAIYTYANKLPEAVKRKYDALFSREDWDKVRAVRLKIMAGCKDLPKPMLLRIYKEDLPQLKKALIVIVEKEYHIDYETEKASWPVPTHPARL